MPISTFPYRPLTTVADASPAGRPLPEGALDGDFEQLVVASDPESGLLALICVDSTLLGPADGGVRMLPYPTFGAAVADVTRLARSMTLKYAAADEARGGGKAVIIGNPRTDRTEALLRAFGRAVDALGGRYWAGLDSGLTLDDMTALHRETPYVSTLPGASGGVGDIAPATASGVLHAMRACAERVWGTPSLAGLRVSLQGVGACGSNALAELVAEGARVTIADVDTHLARRAAQRHDVAVVAPEDIWSVPADVAAPFALGGAVDLAAVEALHAGGVRVLAGSANNVLAASGPGDDAVERALVDAGICWAVDFIANAGGCIADADRFRPGGHDPARVTERLAGIGPRTHAVLDAAERDGALPSEAATAMAHARLAAARSNAGSGTAAGGDAVRAEALAV